jgi:ABC-type Na+ efflux pump permease subunit
MTFLPIVDRELRVAARLTATYRNRTITAGAVTVVAVLMLLFGSFSGVPSLIGGAMFRTLGFLTLLFCLFEGVRKTADCLTEEKREGTLGLLFLTDLKGYDIVLGKLAATSLNSFYGLLSILPVLALPLLLGGVTPGEFWRMALALFNILFFSLCAGIWVSSWSGGERQNTMGRAFFLILIICATPLFAPVNSVRQFSPVDACATGFDTNFNFATGARDYWHSIWIGQGLGWILLIAASVMAPRYWQDRDERRFSPDRMRWWGQWRRGDPEARARRRAQMLDINPMYWLAARNPGQRLLPGGLAVLAATGIVGFFVAGSVNYLPVFFGCAILINLVLKMRVAAQASQCLAEARRNNALEMLLATPLKVNEIISGQLLAIKRIFLLPVLFILCLELTGVVGASALGPSGGWDAGVIIAGLVYLAIFALDMAAVIWAGMWFGLSSKKENQAATRTILWVLIAPLGCLIFSCFGLLPFIGWPIFWIVWARGKLQTGLREMAAQQYGFSAPNTHWLPGMASMGMPPPLPRPLPPPLPRPPASPPKIGPE